MMSLRWVIPVLFSLAAAGAVTASEGGGGGSLIEPAVGTMFWTLLTFLLMVVVLGRYAWKPLIGALDAREKSITDTIDRANQDRTEAEALLQQHRDLLDEARRERAEAVARGQQDAEKLKTEILDEARKQREQVLEQTRGQVAAEMREARAELRLTAVDLSIRAAEKLLTKNLDDATQRKLVEDHLLDLERSDDSGSLPS
jgi:F-type H+-transporting ATPase subunit b